jgi:hypothetical protein
MRKLKTFVAVLMLVFVLGLAAPQALAGETSAPPAPGETQSPPGETNSPPGDGHTTGFADWASALSLIFGNSWTI